MKVSSIHVPKLVKTAALTLPLMLAPAITRGQINNSQQDIFIKTTSADEPLLTDSISIAPVVQIGDDYKYMAAVVDLSEKTLYHYDLGGVLIGVYPVATGKKTTPTRTGIRKISHIENYPYKNAPETTKRHKNPNDYGVKVICLDEIDLETGKIIPGNGQFIHGTFKPESIGKSVSKGCVRLRNEDVEELTQRLYKNQYVLIKE